jgi:biotin-dependent carboxylase-like uncharacterized protein
MNKLGHIEVIHPGLYTTVQDVGRFGYRRYGIPQSGAMDSQAMRVVNLLLGVPEHNPVLECTLRGGKYKFNASLDIAIAGATMPMKLNDKVIDATKVIHINTGDVLTLGFATTGLRTYIGFGALIDLPLIMESYSTCVLAGFGGFHGRALIAGDQIELNSIERKINNDAYHYNMPDPSLPLELVPGPEWDFLSDVQQAQLLKQKYRIDPNSNRQAILLQSAEPIKIPNNQITSSATVLGTVQLLPNGKLVVLMHDGQTTGGYPRIGRIKMNDLGRLAQMGLGFECHITLTE